MNKYKCYIAQPAPTEGDAANYWHEMNYYHPDTKESVSWYILPPGALFEHAYSNGKPGLDGKMWILKLPDGYPWDLNAPSGNGASWAITGSAPDFSAQPSIHITADHDGIISTIYHGYLTDGYLISTPDSPC